jgi:hypothetical protein
MAIVATMAVVRCNPKLLAATVDLSAPGAAAGVALAWYSSVGYFTGTNHGMPAMLVDAMEAGPGTMASFAMPENLAPSLYSTLLENFRSEDKSAASLLFCITQCERSLEAPEHGVISFGCFAKLSGGGFPLEHWTEVGIRTTFFSAVKVCSINLACLSGFDYFTVAVIVKLEYALDVPMALLPRFFSGDVGVRVGVEENGLSVSSGLFADSVSPDMDYESRHGPHFMGFENELSGVIACINAANQWPIGISGRHLSFTPQAQVCLAHLCCAPLYFDFIFSKLKV